MGRRVAVDTAALLVRILRDGPDATIMFREAVALVAVRTRTPPDEELGLAKDRVAHRIRSAMGRGEIPSTGNAREASRATFTVDALVRWARRTFAGRPAFNTAFDDLPIKPQASGGVGSAVLGFRVQGFGYSVPATLAACRELIGQQAKRILELEALEPDAIEWRAEQARKAARNKGRHPLNKKRVAKNPS